MRILIVPAMVLMVFPFAVAQSGKATQKPSPLTEVPVAKGAAGPFSTTKPTLAMERYSGSPMRTTLSYGIALNKESQMSREYFVLRDDGSPLSISGSAGINVFFDSGSRSSGEYQYKVPYTVIAKEPITAFELRVHVLDVFGRLLKTLSATEVRDFDGEKNFNDTWRILSENEASEAFASVAYIAQVRTAAGKVYEMDRLAVLDQLRKVGKRITEADLDPKREGTVRK